MGSEQSSSRSSNSQEATQWALERAMRQEQLRKEATLREAQRVLEIQRIKKEAAARDAARVLEIEKIKREVLQREAEQAKEIEQNKREVLQREAERVMEMHRIKQGVIQREAERLKELERINREAVQNEANRILTAEREVQRALDEQKKLYEQRLRSQLSTAETSQVNNTNTSSRLTSHAHNRASNNPIAASRLSSSPARRQYEVSRRAFLRSVIPQAPLPLRNPSLERKRTPYNFNREALENVTVTSPTHNIYPNLNNNQPCTSRSNSTSSEASGSASGVPRNSAHDFVFVNKNGGTQRFEPSAPSRDRSTSRSRAHKTEKDQLNCPTCNNRYGVYIYQCPNGHSSCKDCRMRCAACGICGKFITNMRNIALEDFVSQQKVQCSNASDGCNLYLKLDNLEAHLKECPFSETACPVNGTLGNCQWRGKISQLAMHFDNQHPAQRQADVDTEMYLANICNNEHIMYLLTIGTYNFLFHLNVSETMRTISMAVQLLGTGVSASKWNYEVHVYNKKQPRRKYEYSSACTSATVPVKDIFKESNCATLPLSYAMTFVNQGSLTYKFYIKKENDYKRGFNNYHRGRGGAIRKNQS